MGMTNFQALIVGTVSFFVNVLFVILYVKIKQLIKKKTAKKEKIKRKEKNRNYDSLLQRAGKYCSNLQCRC